MTAQDRHNGYQYYCEVSNAVGSVLSDTVSLAVTGDPDFVLPENLTQIAEEAFAGGASGYVRLGSNVTSIGARAFADCDNLQYVYIPSTVTSLGSNIFRNDTDVGIIGAKGSRAETYAKNAGLPFFAE